MIFQKKESRSSRRKLILKGNTWLYIYTNSISKGILVTESVYVMCVWIRQLLVRARGKYNNVWFKMSAQRNINDEFLVRFNLKIRAYLRNDSLRIFQK